MHSVFAAITVLIAASVSVANAQNAYSSILAEAQKWQEQNPNSCGHDVSTCGVAKMVEKFESCSAFRIVNGCPVEKPLTVGWQAAILAGGGLCSAVLISPQVILTAAHCLAELSSPSGIKVFLGVNSIDARGSGQQFGASAFGVHPKWDDRRISSDTALIKLDRPAQLDETNGIRTVCLPTAGAVAPSNKQCLVSGFGTNNPRARDPRQRGSGEMRYTLLQKRSENECRFYNSFDSSVSFCALGQRNSQGTDTCQGDSGSGLLCKDDSGRWTVTGIVSYGASNCGEVAGVYADVAKLGITVSSRAATQDKCKTAADSKPAPSPPTPQPPQLASNGPKKPTYSGTSTSIPATIKDHGCRVDSECQSNICRKVALCTEKNNFGNSFGSGSFSTSGKLPNGGSFHFSSQQVSSHSHHHFREARSVAQVQKAGMYNVTTAQDLLKSTGMLAARQHSGRGNMSPGFRQILNAIRGNVGMLFARRNCQVHSVCSAERHQPQQQAQDISPMLVAMFEDEF